MSIKQQEKVAEKKRERHGGDNPIPTHIDIIGFSIYERKRRDFIHMTGMSEQGFTVLALIISQWQMYSKGVTVNYLRDEIHRHVGAFRLTADKVQRLVDTGYVEAMGRTSQGARLLIPTVRCMEIFSRVMNGLSDKVCA